MQEKRELTDFQPTFPTVAGAEWKLSGLAPGSYAIEWWDTNGQGVLKTEPLTVTDAGAIVRLPPFERDLAFKIRPA